MRRPYKRIGWPTIAGLGLVVVAFMVLSLLVTATGTARFAVAMGYDARAGYAVGVIFDIAKGILPVALLALLALRAFGSACLLGGAWICLVTFSWLATHATVSTAISSIERTGTWKMEVRGNTKAELMSVEQRLATLSRPAPPRPVKTVAEALASTSVPSGVWKDSHECAAIQDSAYFAKACAQIVQLRRELAAARTTNGCHCARPSCARAWGGSDPGNSRSAARGIQRYPGPRAARWRHGRCRASAYSRRRADQLLWARRHREALWVPRAARGRRRRLQSAPSQAQGGRSGSPRGTLPVGRGCQPSLNPP